MAKIPTDFNAWKLSYKRDDDEPKYNVRDLCAAFNAGKNLGRGMAVRESIEVIEHRVVANEHIPVIYLREHFKTELESI